MTTAWILNTAGLFAITAGTLLIFLYLWRSTQFEDQWLSVEGKLAYQKHRRLIVIAVALIAAWLMIHYLALILL